MSFKEKPKDLKTEIVTMGDNKEAEEEDIVVDSFANGGTIKRYPSFPEHVVALDFGFTKDERKRITRLCKLIVKDKGTGDRQGCFPRTVVEAVELMYKKTLDNK